VLGIPGVPLAADVIAAVGFGTAFRAFLDVALPARLAASEPSIGGMVRRRMGSGMLEPDDLPVERVAPFLRDALRSNGSLTHAVRVLRANAPAGAAIAGIRGGVHRIAVELLADLERLGVELRTGARVDSVDAGLVRVGPETLRGKVIVAAAGVLEPNVRRNLTLATLVLEAPELDAAPRGTGVLVADGVAGIRARALTHSTAKWPWLAERTGGRHVVRLSYDETPSEETAREDAAALLGVKIPAQSMVDFALAAWTRPAPESAPPPGITAIGEATAGSGLAAVVARANSAADDLLAIGAAGSAGGG
jgi:oxygen-dependent protoporphyrinogen oxidase